MSSYPIQVLITFCTRVQPIEYVSLLVYSGSLAVIPLMNHTVSKTWLYCPSHLKIEDFRQICLEWLASQEKCKLRFYGRLLGREKVDRLLHSAFPSAMWIICEIHLNIHLTFRMYISQYEIVIFRLV